MRIHGSSRSGGARRTLVRALVPLAAVAMGATVLAGCQLPGSTFVVTTTVDGTDSAPGDGVCESALGNDVCTVRAAVMEANATAGTNNITLADGATYDLTLPGTNEDGAASGDLDVTGSVAITGGATIDANGLDRVLDVRSEVLILDGVSVTGGHLPSTVPDAVGGGIRVAAGANLLAGNTTVHDNDAFLGGGGIAGSGPVTLASSSVRDNSSVGDIDLQFPNIAAFGAGISMQAADLNIVDSSITGNIVTVFGIGGGIYSSGTVVIDRTTVAGNDAPYVGGISASTISVRRSTITGNSGGTAALSGSSVMVVSSTVAGQNHAAIHANSGSVSGSILDSIVADCVTPTITSGGYNVTTDTSCGTGVGDTVAADPGLLPLADNGGPTNTRLILPTSPALDAIPVGTLALCDGSATSATDQRGHARPVGSGCDIGAVERTP